MEMFGIRIYKEYFNFAAAHFLIFEDGTREELHGHNYQVQMQLEGYLDQAADIFIDFLHIKPIVKAVCDSIDHKTLLPRFSPHLAIETTESSYDVTYMGKDRWVFPRRDVVLVPVTNTSAERLAEFLCHQTLRALRLQYPEASIRFIEFSVEESRGQAALYRRLFEEPQALKDIPLMAEMSLA